MQILVILAGALIALFGAWAINAFIGMLSGERPGGLLRDWWDIFSNMGRSEFKYAEPLPDFLTRRKFTVGDKIRVLLLPLDFERSLSPESQILYRRCVGKVLRVERVDEFGSLELHVMDDGSQSPDRSHHIIFIGPKCVEPVSHESLQEVPPTVTRRK